MCQFHPKNYLVMLCLLLATAACQPGAASPTLPPGAVEVPFETVVLDEEGSREITQPPQLFAITDVTEVIQLQHLVKPDAFQQLQKVDWDVYSVIAIFRVPSAGCSAFGVTVERLIRSANTLTVYIYDWRPPAGHACAETSLSAYSLVKIRKTAINLDAVEMILQSQRMERSG